MKIQGCLRIILLLGLCAGMELHAQESNTNLIESIKAKAENGDAKAEYELGVRYDYGNGVVKNEAEAVKWYRKAAEQGFADAQFFMARCYSSGKGVARDVVETYKWLLLAAEQGDESAKTIAKNLEAELSREQITEGKKRAHEFKPIKPASSGLQEPHPEYSNGKAAIDLQAKAVRGDAEAQYKLGACYRDGEEVAKDLPEAFKWFRKAAEQNNVMAQCNLGVCYLDGKGVTKDPVEAVRWFRKAAEQNCAEAQINLSGCYRDGSGVAKDLAEAYKWLLIAESETGGNFLVKTMVDRLENKLSPEQIAEGKKRAADFKLQKQTQP